MIFYYDKTRLIIILQTKVEQSKGALGGRSQFGLKPKRIWIWYGALLVPCNPQP